MKWEILVDCIVLEPRYQCNSVKVLFFYVQNFSAVVGPNGSGKSNVIDAMLFVFGKRAKQVDFEILEFVMRFA